MAVLATEPDLADVVCMRERHVLVRRQKLPGMPRRTINANPSERPSKQRHQHCIEHEVDDLVSLLAEDLGHRPADPDIPRLT